MVPPPGVLSFINYFVFLTDFKKLRTGGEAIKGAIAYAAVPGNTICISVSNCSICNHMVYLPATDLLGL